VRGVGGSKRAGRGGYLWEEGLGVGEERGGARKSGRCVLDIGVNCEAEKRAKAYGGRGEEVGDEEMRGGRGMGKIRGGKSRIGGGGGGGTKEVEERCKGGVPVTAQVVR